MGMAARLVCLAMLVGAVLAPGTALAQPPPPGDAGAAAAVALVRRYAAALTARDLAGALACFNEGAGYASGWGQQHIVERLRQDFATERWMQVIEAQVDRRDEDTYAVTWRWRSNYQPFQRLGVPAYEGVDVAVVRDGKILQVTGQIDQDSLRQRQPYIEAALQAQLAQSQAQATQMARATAVAEAGALRGLPDPQSRGVPPAPSLVVAGIVALGLTAALAAFSKGAIGHREEPE